MLRAFLNAATRKGYSPLRAYVNESGNHSSRQGELHYMCFLVAGLSLHSGRVPHPCGFSRVRFFFRFIAKLRHEGNPSS
jgi:hypothetical protein